MHVQNAGMFQAVYSIRNRAIPSLILGPSGIKVDRVMDQKTEGKTCLQAACCSNSLRVTTKALILMPQGAFPQEETINIPTIRMDSLNDGLRGITT